jgi:hypothetical protein
LRRQANAVRSFILVILMRAADRGEGFCEALLLLEICALVECEQPITPRHREVVVCDRLTVSLTSRALAAG